MNTIKIIGFLALLVAILPYGGIPGDWYRPLVFFIGLLISFLSFKKAHDQNQKNLDLNKSFTENNPDSLSL